MAASAAAITWSSRATSQTMVAMRPGSACVSPASWAAAASSLVLVEVGQQHAGAVAQQAARGGEADAAGGAGHDRTALVELHGLPLPQMRWSNTWRR
jgi:hypothetical protein